MAGLTRHGSDVESVFDLLGHDENDVTAALGFALANCSPLLDAVVQRLQPPQSGWELDGAPYIALEKRDPEGRTDLEIQLPNALLVCEAKRGWHLPSKAQLRRYTSRIHRRGGGALVTLSQASRALAAVNLPSKIDGVPVIHLPWRDVLTDIADVRPTCRGQQRLWLDQLRNYLRGVIRMRSVADSWTYCVVLNNARPGNGGAHTFLEFVTNELCYFHPYGVGGWPTDPPNFMAFRWDGAVQRIHRVVRADVVPSLLERWPDVPATPPTERPHAVYDLGPRLPPLDPIPNGAQYRASRLWVLLDQLQTAPMLAEARKGTQKLQG